MRNELVCGRSVARMHHNRGGASWSCPWPATPFRHRQGLVNTKDPELLEESRGSKLSLEAINKQLNVCQLDASMR